MLRPKLKIASASKIYIHKQGIDLVYARIRFFTKIISMKLSLCYSLISGAPNFQKVVKNGQPMVKKFNFNNLIAKEKDFSRNTFFMSHWH